MNCLPQVKETLPKREGTGRLWLFEELSHKRLTQKSIRKCHFQLITKIIQVSIP